MPQDVQFMHELNDKLEALEFYESRRQRGLSRLGYLNNIADLIRQGAYPHQLTLDRPFGTQIYRYLGGRVYITNSITQEIPISVISRVTFIDSQYLSGHSHLNSPIHPQLCGLWQLTQAMHDWDYLSYECFGCETETTIRRMSDDQE